MTTKQMNDLVDRYLDSKGLSNPSIRKRAARKVLGFMDTTGAFLSAGQLALPSDKGVVASAYERHKGLPLNGAEKSVINHIYELAGSSVGKSAPSPAVTPKATKPAACATAPVKGLAAAEKRLIQGEFISVGALSGEMVPKVPGLYCIKLSKEAKLPVEYGPFREDGVVYIGKADNLHERLWKEEVNHQHPATFFRGIGAVLGYLPPKGSLIGYANQNNYEFSAEDTDAVIKWMHRYLAVNWIQLEPSQIVDTEKELIQMYQPMMNTTHNPKKNKALAAARKRCRQYAKGE